MGRKLRDSFRHVRYGLVNRETRRGLTEGRRRAREEKRGVVDALREAWNGLRP